MSKNEFNVGGCSEETTIENIVARSQDTTDCKLVYKRIILEQNVKILVGNLENLDNVWFPGRTVNQYAGFKLPPSVSALP